MAGYAQHCHLTEDEMMILPGGGVLLAPPPLRVLGGHLAPFTCDSMQPLCALQGCVAR